MTARSRSGDEAGSGQEADLEQGAAAALPGRRERAKREKRERLVKAARELFAAKGFTATTTSEIAARADIGAGTLFLYVRSKEELLVTVFHEDMGRVRDEAFATLPPRGTFLDEIFHVYRALMAFHDHDRTLARVYAKEMAFVSEPNRSLLRDFMERLFRETARRVDAAKERGEIAPDVPGELLAQNLFAIFFLHLQDGLGSDVPLLSDEMLGVLRDGFALTLRGVGAAAGASTNTTTTTTSATSTRARSKGGKA